MIEVNFDAIVGPTHSYAGLAYGNVASMGHEGIVSHPKQAALQGLKKMKLLMDLGCVQGILPPQRRPSLVHLRNLGFRGSDDEVIREAAVDVPHLFFCCSSASSMWAANAATVAPSCDTVDGKFHFSVANLLNRFHRSIEAEETFATFKKIFPDPNFFTIHPPLHKGGRFGDEGAANHTRFCKEHDERGVHLFVYSDVAFERLHESKFPLRQSLEASQAIARRHGLSPDQVVFAKQNPAAIDAGVFHNDVIAVGHKNFFFLHKEAFENTHVVLEEIDKKLQRVSKTALDAHLVSEITLKQAVNSYLFNSQIISGENNKRILIAPVECKALSLSLPFDEIHYVNLRESMQNGGGPACLRLRIPLTQAELENVNPFYILNDKLYGELVKWVEHNYRETLTPQDVMDPRLYHESEAALHALHQILTH